MFALNRKLLIEAFESLQRLNERLDRHLKGHP